MALNRWKIAQDAERESWSDPSRALKDIDGWIKFIKSNFGFDSLFFEQKLTLEIGCGPYGLIHFINCSKGFKVGLDPEPHTHVWNKLDNKTLHIVAVGELLPLRDNAVDRVICFNVLDHVFNPEEVVKEATRVLRENGKLLLWVVTLRDFLKGIRGVLNVIDKPHPHHFTSKEVLSFLQLNGLKVLSVLEASFQKGNVLSNFIKSSLQGRFKVAYADLLVSNLYLIAEKR